jgi:pyruvate ferredoxin oxidoreductase gamma subunit
MIEIRLHGRGGAGAVTSAELLAIAAINLGKYAQAFPSFGPERRGAPVVAFCRIADRQIKLRTNINQPDIVLVLDPSLLHIVNVAAGLRQGGMLVINSRHSCQDLRAEFGFTCSIATVDATAIAREATGLPITNVTMLGALLKAREVFPPAALTGPVNKRFGRIAEKNLTAFHRAYAETSVLL